MEDRKSYIRFPKVVRDLKIDKIVQQVSDPN